MERKYLLFIILLLLFLSILACESKQEKADRFLGKWSLNGDSKLGVIEITKKDDEYVWWGGNPYNLDDKKPYPNKIDFVNATTFKFIARHNKFQPDTVAEAKLGNDDILAVNILGMALQYKRIPK